eukprot:Nk52_evm6s1916 gene=Nk52_evmTU6s1916
MACSTRVLLLLSLVALAVVALSTSPAMASASIPVLPKEEDYHALQARGGIARMFGTNCEGIPTGEGDMNNYIDKCDTLKSGGFLAFFTQFTSSCEECNRKSKRIGPFCWDINLPNSEKEKGYISLDELQDYAKEHKLIAGGVDFSSSIEESANGDLSSGMGRELVAFYFYNFQNAFTCMKNVFFDSFWTDGKKKTESEACALQWQSSESNPLRGIQEAIVSTVRGWFTGAGNPLTAFIESIIKETQTRIENAKEGVEDCSVLYHYQNQCAWRSSVDPANGFPAHAYIASKCELMASMLTNALEEPIKNLPDITGWATKEASQFLLFFTYTVNYQVETYDNQLKSKQCQGFFASLSPSCVEAYFLFTVYNFLAIDEVNLEKCVGQSSFVKSTVCRLLTGLLKKKSFWDWVGERIGSALRYPLQYVPITSGCDAYKEIVNGTFTTIDFAELVWDTVTNQEPRSAIPKKAEEGVRLMSSSSAPSTSEFMMSGEVKMDVISAVFKHKESEETEGAKTRRSEEKLERKARSVSSWWKAITEVFTASDEDKKKTENISFWEQLTHKIEQWLCEAFGIPYSKEDSDLNNTN